MLSRQEQKGFTLIELLIVISIIGILAAIAIPMYRAQTIRARLTEVTNGMSNIVSAVSGYYQETESFPSASSRTNIQSSLGVSLNSLSRIQAVTVVDGVITCTIANISSEVDGSTLILSPVTAADGSISWAWSGSIKEAFRPK